MTAKNPLENRASSIDMPMPTLFDEGAEYTARIEIWRDGEKKRTSEVPIDIAARFARWSARRATEAMVEIDQYGVSIATYDGHRPGIYVDGRRASAESFEDAVRMRLTVIPRPAIS